MPFRTIALLSTTVLFSSCSSLYQQPTPDALHATIRGVNERGEVCSVFVLKIDSKPTNVMGAVLERRVSPGLHTVEFYFGYEAPFRSAKTSWTFEAGHIYDCRVFRAGETYRLLITDNRARKQVASLPIEIDPKVRSSTRADDLKWSLIGYSAVQFGR